MAKKSKQTNKRDNTRSPYALGVKDLVVLASFRNGLLENTPDNPVTFETIVEKMKSEFDIDMTAGHLSKRLTIIESSVGAEIIRRGKRRTTGYYPHGEAICAAAEIAVRGLISSIQIPAENSLSIAMGESALRYLFETPAIKRWLGEMSRSDVAIRTLLYDQETTMRDLQTGKLDLACAWHRHDFIPDDSIEASPLGSRREEVQPAVVCHASHPMASLLNGDVENWAENEVVARQTVFVSKVRGVHEYAKALGGWGNSNIVLLPGISSVISHIRHGTGIGIFPVWKGVLRGLERDDHLRYAFPLENRIAQKIRFTFSIFRCKSRRKSEVAKSFVAALGKGLEFLEGPGLWHPAPGYNGIAGGVDIASTTWHVRHLHIPPEGPLAPRWEKWTVSFKFSPVSGNLIGTAESASPQFDALKVDGHISDRRLILYGSNKNRDRSRQAWSACITKAVHDGKDERLCLIGCISAADPRDTPTAGLIILANYDIGSEDLWLLARDTPASFLAHAVNPDGD